MNHDLGLDSHTLRNGQVRRIPPTGNRRVECLTGVIWITQDGDRRDIILEAGQAFELDRDGDALLSAFADSRYLLLESCPPLVTAPGPSAHRAVARP